MSTEFSKRLFELIKESKKSVNQVEQELGIPRNALHNYKNGRIPSAGRLLVLSKYFDVSPEYLYGEVPFLTSKINISTLFNHLSFTEKIEMALISQEWSLKQIPKDNRSDDGKV